VATKRSKAVADGGKLNMAAELGGNFGDKRLNKRAAAVASAWVQGGDTSFPELLGEDGSEGLYRLINNDKFAFTEAVSTHAAQTVARAKQVGGVILVAHDSTDFAVALHDHKNVREHFAIKSSRVQGFELHVSKVIAFDQHNTPLGVIGLRPYVHDKHLGDGERGDAARDYWWSLGGLYTNEQQRWFEAVEAAARDLGDKAQDAVHVMDREADDYAMLCWMEHHGHRFVQRANTARRFVGKNHTPVAQALVGRPALAHVTVTLGARSPARSEKAKKTHPDRTARVATLTVRSDTVRVMAPKNASKAETVRGTQVPMPAHLDLTLVDVREEHPPAGEEPVHWLLLTTEPADTVQDVLAIVDEYRGRWGIEVFFKVLKTGLGLEERQMESADAMLRVVSLALPVAVQVLRLRHMADVMPGALWSTVLTKAQFEVLRRKCPKAKLTAKSTVEHVVVAVATLGGFLKSNKVPGWQTIYRGWEYLETLAEGYELALGF